MLDPATGAKIDMFINAASDDFTVIRLDRRVQASVLGVDTWIATPEDIILAKLRWRRESRCELQWRDCVAIAAAAANVLDIKYLRTWADRLDVSDDLNELLAE